MKTIKCWAKVDYNLEWNGTPEDLIELVEKMSMERYGQSLDSHDLGDAMGFIMQQLDTAFDGRLTWETETAKLTAEKNYDTFVWDNLTDTQENILMQPWGK